MDPPTARRRLARWLARRLRHFRVPLEIDTTDTRKLRVFLDTTGPRAFRTLFTVVGVHGRVPREDVANAARRVRIPLSPRIHMTAGVGEWHSAAHVQVGAVSCE
jgi:hypothetical protein